MKSEASLPLRGASRVAAGSVPPLIREGGTAPHPARTGGTDEELVARIVRGDIDLFEILIQRHQKPIINFLYRMIGHYDSAIDLAQDVFTKSFVALDRFDPAYRFTTWIYRIASNCAIDHLRRNRIATVSLDQPVGSEDGEFVPEVRSSGASPMEEFAYRETAERLSRAIRALPPAYRELILLRHVRHLRYDEIGAICGLPIGTVKNRIFRARLILRRAIEGGK